ncbi:uncharacterized protein [Vulpes vulpes]|uniref:Uncharacterized protein isoform X3 n=1 Tax=Vulpes vulpes TaxID=9627 RepID=A0ABM4ZFX0_VULVU
MERARRAGGRPPAGPGRAARGCQAGAAASVPGAPAARLLVGGSAAAHRALRRRDALAPPRLSPRAAPRPRPPRIPPPAPRRPPAPGTPPSPRPPGRAGRPRAGARSPRPPGRQRARGCDRQAPAASAVWTRRGLGGGAAPAGTPCPPAGPAPRPTPAEPFRSLPPLGTKMRSPGCEEGRVPRRWRLPWLRPCPPLRKEQSSPTHHKTGTVPPHTSLKH